jgi:hypothetical protein
MAPLIAPSKAKNGTRIPISTQPVAQTGMFTPTIFSRMFELAKVKNHPRTLRMRPNPA